MLNYADKIKELEIFSSLCNGTLDKLCKIGYVKSYSKGEHIFRDKEIINTIYIVFTGKISLYKLNESAQKKVVFILGTGEIINESVLDETPESISCEIFETAEILCFKKNEFINIMKEDFQLTMCVLNSANKKVRRLYRQIKNTTPMKIEKKLAAKLWKLGKDHGIVKDDGVLIDLKISITYLADMFGTPRETISRAMKILQENQLVFIKNKNIIIKDMNDLSNYFKGIG